MSFEIIVQNDTKDKNHLKKKKFNNSTCLKLQQQDKDDCLFQEVKRVNHILHRNIPKKKEVINYFNRSYCKNYSKSNNNYNI